jgi:hypothetical protein
VPGEYRIEAGHSIDDVRAEAVIPVS